MKDEDWIDLLAGKDVEGVSEKEKETMAKIRKQLLDDVPEEEPDITEEELIAEREKLQMLWPEVISEIATSTPNEQAQKRGESTTEKPSNVIRTNRFRNVFVPLTMAASVAMMVVGVDLYDPNPNRSEDYFGVVRGAQTAKSTQRHELIVSNPRRSLKKLKKRLLKNDIAYSFFPEGQGWKASFDIKENERNAFNDALKPFGVIIEKAGDVELILKKSN